MPKRNLSSLAQATLNIESKTDLWKNNNNNSPSTESPPGYYLLPLPWCLLESAYSPSKPTYMYLKLIASFMLIDLRGYDSKIVLFTPVPYLDWQKSKFYTTRDNLATIQRAKLEGAHQHFKCLFSL